MRRPSPIRARMLTASMLRTFICSRRSGPLSASPRRSTATWRRVITCCRAITGPAARCSTSRPRRRGRSIGERSRRADRHRRRRAVDRRQRTRTAFDRERYGTSASYAANGRITAGPIDENLLTFSWYQAKGLSERCGATCRQSAPSSSAARPMQVSRRLARSPGRATSSPAGGRLPTRSPRAQLQHVGQSVVDLRHRGVPGLPPLSRRAERPGVQGIVCPLVPVRRLPAGVPAHGTHVPRELWQFGEPGDPYYDALESALRLRYALMPYISLCCSGRCGP